MAKKTKKQSGVSQEVLEVKELAKIEEIKGLEKFIDGSIAKEDILPPVAEPLEDEAFINEILPSNEAKSVKKPKP